MKPHPHSDIARTHNWENLNWQCVNVNYQPTADLTPMEKLVSIPPGSSSLSLIHYFGVSLRKRALGILT